MLQLKIFLVYDLYKEKVITIIIIIYYISVRY